MFDWVLNTPLNTIANFLLDVSKLKSMTFRNFFSTVNFSYQYPPEAKAYLEPSRIPAIKLFREFFLFLRNSQEKSLFNKVIGFFPATSLKESTPIKVLSDKFFEILKTTFLRNAARRLFLFYEKMFYQ